jgi:hypothetical protein
MFIRKNIIPRACREGEFEDESKGTRAKERKEYKALRVAVLSRN